MYLYEIIKNLEKVTQELSKIAKEQNKYHPKYIQNLEYISTEIHQFSNDLKVIEDERTDIYDQCTCSIGCLECLGMKTSDFF